MMSLVQPTSVPVVTSVRTGRSRRSRDVLLTCRHKKSKPLRLHSHSSPRENSGRLEVVATPEVAHLDTTPSTSWRPDNLIGNNMFGTGNPYHPQNSKPLETDWQEDNSAAQGPTQDTAERWQDSNSNPTSSKQKLHAALSCHLPKLKSLGKKLNPLDRHKDMPPALDFTSVRNEAAADVRLQPLDSLRSAEEATGHHTESDGRIQGLTDGEGPFPSGMLHLVERIKNKDAVDSISATGAGANPKNVHSRQQQEELHSSRRADRGPLLPPAWESRLDSPFDADSAEQPRKLSRKNPSVSRHYHVAEMSSPTKFTDDVEQGEDEPPSGAGVLSGRLERLTRPVDRESPSTSRTSLASPLSPTIFPISKSAMKALIPLSGSGCQVLQHLGGPLDWMRRFVLSMGGAVLLYNVNPLFTIIAAFYWAWAPIWSAALSNMALRKKYPYAGIWIGRVLMSEVHIGEGGKRKWRLLVGDRAGVRVEIISNPPNLTSKLAKGEPVQMVAVSDVPSFSRFRVLREAFLPRRGVWLAGDGESSVERTVFETLQVRIVPAVLNKLLKEDEEDWESLLSLKCDEANETVRQYEWDEDVSGVGPQGSDLDVAPLAIFDCNVGVGDGGNGAGMCSCDHIGYQGLFSEGQDGEMREAFRENF